LIRNTMVIIYDTIGQNTNKITHFFLKLHFINFLMPSLTIKYPRKNQVSALLLQFVHIVRHKVLFRSFLLSIQSLIKHKFFFFYFLFISCSRIVSQSQVEKKSHIKVKFVHVLVSLKVLKDVNLLAIKKTNLINFFVNLTL